ncbi:hypothetical protein DAEQUDRAFT_659162 [Daedalea quercina L-15889]|uniref:Nucleolar 27S pre-rRNA processing Urb2/Npa2 C-terminal domain-containing protein n=1 Tax=Daedalea quercina L-15889 TaxID=1314783 RepID=A0A165UFH3_9APHY|nr:hypothetical protein DAEQUDRAFT_659162 [Daedalea quercina L-15889]
MIASSLGSAQDFIKTLKAHPDPPHADGPSKIELAREAWNNAAFYFPNKDETIVDWLLTRLLKDKAKVGEANPVIDSRYWQLLFDILCPPDEATGKRTDTRHAAKRWLLPLLNRIPLAPIVTAYFQLSSSVDERARVTLDELSSRCFASIWPLASPKFSPDTLLECFGALLARLATNWRGEDDHPKTDPHISQAALFIISSYRSAYGNLANKKKLYTTFLQHHFLHWLQCSQYGNLHGAAQCPLISEIYSAGTETLFSVDVLRNIDDHMCDATLKDALRKALSSSTKAVLRALPSLFASFVLSLKRNRNALFSQSSNNAAGHSSTQVQVDGLAFYALCEENIIASPSSHVPLMWDTRIALLKTVDSESLYHASDANGTMVLRDSGSLAIRVLTSSREDAVYVDKAVDVLAALTRIDYDLMAPNLPVIWPALARWQASGIEPREAYATALGSPLFSLETLDRLGSAIRGFLTPGQLREVTRVVVEKFRGAFEQYREQEKRATAEDGDGPRKKRRKSTSDNTRVDPQWCAVEFALVSRIGVVVLSSLAIRTTSDDSRQELREVVGVACASVIPRALKATLKALGADNRRGTWAWQVVATGALHLYHDRKCHGWPDVQLNEDVGMRLRALLGNDDILPEFSLMIARTLLNDTASDVTGAQRIIDDVLRCLEGLPSLDNTDELRWSGKSHELNDNKSFAPLRVSRMLSQQLTPATILAVTLHSADVWELRRFRDAFSAQLRDATAPLANMDVQKLLESTKTSVPRKLQAEVISSIAAFGILLHTPEDYLPRAMRLDFLQRALVADVLIGTGAVKDKDVDPGSLLIVREFIRRVTSHSGNIDQLGVEGYFGYLLRPESLRPVDTTLGEEDDLNSVTLDLIGSYLASFLLRARNGEERLATKAVEDIKKYLDVPVEQRLSSSSLLGDGTLLRLVSTVASNYALTQLPQQLQVSLRGLYERMVAVYSTSLLRTPPMDESSVQVGLRDDSLNVLRMWSHTLWLGRWIQADMNTLPRFGTLLLGQLLADRQETPSAAICLALLDILKEEFYSATTGQRQTYIGLMVAGYVTCSRCCDYDGMRLSS